MNNLSEICLVRLGVGANYARCLVILCQPYLFCNTESSFLGNTSDLHFRYSFVPNSRGLNKIHQGDYQDFLKYSQDWPGQIFFSTDFGM